MSTIAQEVKEISELEVIFLVNHFTEEYFKSEGWTKRAREVLYERYDEIVNRGNGSEKGLWGPGRDCQYQKGE